MNAILQGQQKSTIDEKALLPRGGQGGQVLAKNSDLSYDVEWKDLDISSIEEQLENAVSIDNGAYITLEGEFNTGGHIIRITEDSIYVDNKLVGSKLPSGGATGQVLTKKSDSDFDAEWVDSSVDLSGYAPIDSPNFINSISMGRAESLIIGKNSCAIGLKVKASGDYSHAEGLRNQVQKMASHVEGSCNTVETYFSHSEGNGNVVLSDSYFVIPIDSYSNNILTVDKEKIYTLYDNEEISTLVSQLNDTPKLRLVSGTDVWLSPVECYVASFDAENFQITIRDIIEDITGTIPTRKSFYALLYYKNGSYDATYASHVEGYGNTVYGEGSHAEGIGNVVLGRVTSTHVEGYSNWVLGSTSHVEGILNNIKGTGGHAEGNGNLVSKDVHLYHIEGSYNTLLDGGKFSVESCHVEGTENSATNLNGHIEGARNVATHPYELYPITKYSSGGNILYFEDYIPVPDSYILNEMNSAAGAEVILLTAPYGKAVEGYTLQSINFTNRSITLNENIKDSYIEYCIIRFNISSNTTAEGIENVIHIEGFKNIVCGNSAHAEGKETVALGRCSHASGEKTKALAPRQTVMGYRNIPSDSYTDKLIIGKGSGNYDSANCFRVTDTGVYASGNYNASGADYAEMFEWEDGNPNKEDRRGRFVTLNNDKIQLANPEDTFILGIVSGDPSIVGDVHDDQWQGMYMYDIFGTPIFEDVEIPDELDEDGNIVHPAHTEHRQKINPDYDNTQKYIPRSERPEWDAVGMMGKMVMVDDGTCVANGYADVAEGGIATFTSRMTRYRVMKRLDKNHVKILIS